MVNKSKTAEEVNKAYDSPSWFYDLRGLFILTFAYQATLWNQISFFSKNIKGIHLEAAIGSGSLLYVILKWLKLKNVKYDVIYGFDYAESMLAGAKKRFKRDPNIILEKEDAASLPYENNFFDSVSIANSVHCFPEVEKSLAELVRVTKPKGTIFLNVLLYPKTKGFLDKISNKINNWAIKKGILITPFTEKKINALIDNLNVSVISKDIEGNSMNISLIKED
ncbi:SAM-dependent methyltransferase [Legionella qingyii]|uniref:SAM-dependent methyltransferase n=1 Tax=Legionella qingyii TaxID=2184757 RepID=A0A317U2F0_9GAMM|nr:class I SAM-dependent methyltransferase [Legionella qingyii]PWY54662.1 SAM-dependent methyltransferase [Legionella qingyii]RUR20499.1 class I SAM-dependent methyltransferase [Legionella qingyii]RUR21552.1 class I SAM-dependent methyltransferase [Legionella qingyii]